MSLVQPADVEAQVAPGVDDATLQKIIDREEEWLAARIGPLTGPITQQVYPDSYQVRLRRHTNVAPTISGLATSHTRLSDDGRWLVVDWWPQPTTGFPWPPIALAYTPDDAGDVKQAIIELCRITLTNSPYVREQSDGHEYWRNASPAALRDGIARRVLSGGSTPRTATLPINPTVYY